MSTAFLIPLVLVALLSGAVLLFRYMSKQGEKIVADHAAHLARCKSAKARVLQLGKSVSQVRNGTVTLKIRLEIQPSDAPSYETSTVWEVPQTALVQLQPEQVVPVKIDPDDPQRVYPTLSGARFSEIYWSAWVQKNKNK